MREEDFFDEQEEEEEEEFSGFTIVDESGIDIDQFQKVIAARAEKNEEETMATPVPENELTVMLDNPSALLPDEGEKLTFTFNGEESGSVFCSGKKIGDFKPAFIKRLFETRRGQYCGAVMYTAVPLMIKLLFSLEPAKGYKKIGEK